MSTDGRAIMEGVRRTLGDPDTGRVVVENDELQQAIARHVPLIAKELGLGQAWVTGIVSLIPGTIDYTLSGTDEYEQISEIVYHNDRVPLPIRSLPEVTSRRSGALAVGRPSMCALRPDTTQGVTLAVDTNPQVAETLDALVTLVPAVWEIGDTTPPTIPFSTTAARALELRVASSLAATMGPEKRNALALDKDDSKVWASEAAELIRQERLTVIRWKRSHGPMNHAWFRIWQRG